VEQELLILPEHLSSSLVFRGVRVTRSLPLYIYFVDRSDFEIGIEEELEIWLCSFICVFIYMYLGVFICAFIFLTRFGVKQKSK
jgi:hypothetical protein